MQQLQHLEPADYEPLMAVIKKKERLFLLCAYIRQSVSFAIAVCLIDLIFEFWFNS